MKPGRNQPCHCGSGKKFKHCCGSHEPDNLSEKAGRPATVLVGGATFPVPEVIAMAVKLQGAGEFQRAEDIYRSVLAIQPDYPDALHLLGVVRMQRGDPAAAVDPICRAIACQPGVAMFHSNLGSAYLALKRFEEALAQFSAVLKLDPGSVDALYNSGEALKWLGRADEAVAMFDRVIALRPGYSIAYVRKGEALQKTGKIDEALSCYRQAIASGPGKPAIYFEIGSAFKALGKHDEAIKHFERAVVLRPSWTNAQMKLAGLYKGKGLLREAAECCRRALSFAPNDAFASYLLHALEDAPVERAPAEYVREVFDYYSANFDQHLVEKLNYQAPVVLAAALRNFYAEKTEKQDILDLGCGTGLMGAELVDLKKRLVGVDLSPKMLQKARERGVYDELLEGDLTECMAQLSPGSFDIVVSTDVFIYLGDLTPVFEQCRRILLTGGMFAFSVEHLPGDTRDFMLNLTQRFKHSGGYIESLSSRFGFIVAHREFVALRKEGHETIDGCLYLLSKASV